MHIQQITIKNYRNFKDFTMKFHKGLNVIVGANNSGKTGLLTAIKLLRSPTISVDDFNKNDLLLYDTQYREEAPRITIEYVVCHKILEDNTEDESIIRMLPFLGLKEFDETRHEDGSTVEYSITAIIKTVCTLDEKALYEYKKAVAVISAYDFSSYLIVLESYINRYSWTYFNAVSDVQVDKKEATEIFDIRFISAERTSDDVHKETKREIDAFAKDQNSMTALAQLRNAVALEMKSILDPALEKLAKLFDNENNDIGLSRGNVSISQNIRPNMSVGESYITEVKDTRTNYIVPLDYNGLGYNNLINIYMLIKLTEIRHGKDFRILLLEEPEAHLHPALQYKLFKYLRLLDNEDNLKQQIFVTTHSSNISAVAGIDNMFMLAYECSNDFSDCKEQSLAAHFVDSQDTGTNRADAKKHLSKFLDVTRSDMLFADKVILVEGIAERLLMPLFMEKCGCPYEDEHISVVEIGGKHFEYFVELFNGNTIKKKVLCITDCDFSWIKNILAKKLYEEYKATIPQHISKLQKRFNIDNLFICTQSAGGRTFEDELVLTNLADAGVTEGLYKISASKSVNAFVLKYGFDFQQWCDNYDEIDGRSLPVITQKLDIFQQAIACDQTHKNDYEALFFAELFLHYVKNSKGDMALNILVNEQLANNIVVPRYIQEGLQWLSV